MCAQLLPHAQAILTHDRALKTDSIAWSTLLCNIPRYLRGSGQYSAAHVGAAEATTLLTEELGEEHPNPLTSANNLATVLWAQGRYGAAEEMSRQALDGREKVLGKEHPNTLRSINNLTTALWAQGKYEAAEPTGARCQREGARNGAPQHPR